MNYIKNRPKNPFVLTAKSLAAKMRGVDMDKALKIVSCTLGFFLCVYVMQAIVQYKFNVLREQQFLSSTDIVTIKDRERQLECLARNIYHEAATEPFEGKVAVAQVTINRSEHHNWPKDICAVVYQKNVFMEKVVCQFSWYCEGHGKAKPIRSKEHFDESYRVAKKVLLEGFRLDVMKDAYYYHADYVNPRWNKEKIGKIGNHIFYRENKKT
jgi:spore germination cell wall hydrolase CwlJ-like protein